MQLPPVAVSQTPEEKFREFLASRSRPQRFTEQQRDLVHFIFEQHSHFDAEDLIDSVRKKPLRVSRATIYRTLTKLVDAGLLRQIQVGARTFYEHDYGYPQHEHLYCERCKEWIEFQNPDIATLITDVCREQGFHPNGHTFIVRGLCSKCNTKRRLDLV